MSQVPGGMLENFDDSPRPGGGKRFAVALVVGGVLLTAVVAGMWWWIQSTSRLEYKGPEQLKYPEHRPYR